MNTIHQDATVIAPSERVPQPQEETFMNQEANYQLSIKANFEQLFRYMKQICKIIEKKMELIRQHRCSYKTFLSCQPPEFSGSTKRRRTKSEVCGSYAQREGVVMVELDPSVVG